MRVRSSSGRREIGDIDGEVGRGGDRSMGELSFNDGGGGVGSEVWDMACMFTCQMKETRDRG